jgi:hypothetical protein
MKYKKKEKRGPLSIKAVFYLKKAKNGFYTEGSLLRNYHHFFNGFNKYSKPFNLISYIVANKSPNFPLGKPFV